MLSVNERTSDAIRVEQPERGSALVVTRYGSRKAVVVHPEDFDLLQTLLGLFGEHVPAEMALSDTALDLHRVAEAGEDDEAFDLALLDSHPRG